jgi:catechol 2,3-dioxygenase-like lactoylglutathione lyase family enzyme
MQPIVDHLQITVKDFAESELFYDRLMPILGFDLTRKGKGRVDEHEFDVIEYVHDNITIGINSPRQEVKDDPMHRRRPGSVHHLAFNAGSNEEVDRVAAEIKTIGAQVVDGPRFFPQHGEQYYAFFFKDPSGIKLEVMFEPV